MIGNFYEERRVSDFEKEPVSENATGDPFSESSVSHPLEQISRIHKRSFQDALISEHVIWGDEYGTRFSSRTIKGIPPEGKLPYIEADSSSDSGFRIHYLCKERNARNTEQVSELLRKQGIPTERIRAVSKLTSLTVNTSELMESDWDILVKVGIEPNASLTEIAIPIDQIKEIMLNHLDNAVATWGSADQEQVKAAQELQGKKTPEELDVIKKSIADMNFFYYERDLPIGERWADVDIAQYYPEVGMYINPQGRVYLEYQEFETFEAFIEYVNSEQGQNDPQNKYFRRLISIANLHPPKDGESEIYSSDVTYRAVLQKVFKYLNVAEGYSLDLENPEDLEYYYTELMPKRIGYYLASLHQMGLIHGYPGSKNNLAVGYIMDLDSVTGEQLNDPPVTKEAIENDIYEALDSLYRDYIWHHSIFPDSPDEYPFPGHIIQMFGYERAKQLEYQACHNFFKTYMRFRGLDKNWLKELVETNEEIGARETYYTIGSTFSEDAVFLTPKAKDSTETVSTIAQ